MIYLHITYYKSNNVYIGIGIGIGNFVADISVIGISVKTHIGAPLNISAIYAEYYYLRGLDTISIWLTSKN